MYEYIHRKTCSSEISLIGWLHVGITEKVSWEAKLLQWTGKSEFQNIQVQCDLEKLQRTVEIL